MAASRDQSGFRSTWLYLTVLGFILGGTLGGLTLPSLLPFPPLLIVLLSALLAILTALVLPFLLITVWHLGDTFIRLFPETNLYEWITHRHKPGYQLWRQELLTNADGEAETLDTLRNKFQKGIILSEQQVSTLHSAWKNYIEANGYDYIPISVPLALVERSLHKSISKGYLTPTEMQMVTKMPQSKGYASWEEYQQGESLSDGQISAIQSAYRKYSRFKVEVLSEEERRVLEEGPFFDPRNMDLEARKEAMKADLKLLNLLYSGNRW